MTPLVNHILCSIHIPFPNEISASYHIRTIPAGSTQCSDSHYLMQTYTVVILLCVLSVSLYVSGFLGSLETKVTLQIPSYLSMVRERSICSTTALLDAVTGSLFTMDKKRSYTTKLSVSPDEAHPQKKAVTGLKCDKWAVITSVNAPTVVVKQLAESKEDLCLVVVADKKSPVEYEVDRSHLVYLTVEEQEKLTYRIMKLVPWNHFARKNIGFLYAIEHGAKQIFDLDDDNELISVKDILGQVFDTKKKAYDVVKTQQYVTNPYMIYLNRPGEYIWPRGYPLEAIKTPHDYKFVAANSTSTIESIGVIQYLQDINPDLDAIYRITNTIPTTFDKNMKKCLILSKKSFSPWNAQSTLFNSDTFWGMLLPMTVHGRVSDIWRSYFTQKVMWEQGKVISFCPSIVNHIRNQHRLIKDFDAEMPLYTQTEALLHFLNEWTPTRRDTAGMLEELYVEMYERGIVEKKDVEFVHAWLQDLVSVGYRFKWPVWNKHTTWDRLADCSPASTR